MDIGRFKAYKSIVGTIEITNGKHHGQLLNTKRRITYSADSLSDLEGVFHEAVDSYLSNSEYSNEVVIINKCRTETMKHIGYVRMYIEFFCNELYDRGIDHDKLKMESPEVEIFAEYTPKLKSSTYNSEEYKEFLKEMNVALKHHYEHYRHHPEHFENGINDMNLLDIVEMFCDWKAAVMRHDDGDIMKSIEINAERFGYDDQLKQIFINTAKLMDF